MPRHDLGIHPPLLKCTWLQVVHEFEIWSWSMESITLMYSDWYWYAEYKAKSLSATKGSGLSIFNLAFAVYHLPCLQVVTVLLSFVPSCLCTVCFWEFSIRFLKFNITLKLGLVTSHLPKTPKSSPCWQLWNTVCLPLEAEGKSAFKKYLPLQDLLSKTLLCLMGWIRTRFLPHQGFILPCLIVATC